MSGIVNRGQHSASIDINHFRTSRLFFPTVYRYLPSRHVDAFFDTGTLRLSSFAAFARHTDEARRDRSEGRAHIMADGGGRHFGAVLIGGENCYVLCGSLVLSQSVMDAFPGCDAVIEINDVIQFAGEVGFAIAGYSGSLLGHCIYGGKALVRHMSQDPFPLPQQDQSMDVNHALERAQQISQDQHLFLKDLKHAEQVEYRFLWMVSSPMKEATIIECPRARQFCRRVSQEELDEIKQLHHGKTKSEEK